MSKMRVPKRFCFTKTMQMKMDVFPDTDEDEEDNDPEMRKIWDEIKRKTDQRYYRRISREEARKSIRKSTSSLSPKLDLSLFMSDSGDDSIKEKKARRSFRKSSDSLSPKLNSLLFIPNSGDEVMKEKKEISLQCNLEEDRKNDEHLEVNNVTEKAREVGIQEDGLRSEVSSSRDLTNKKGMATSTLSESGDQEKEVKKKGRKKTTTKVVKEKEPVKPKTAKTQKRVHKEEKEEMNSDKTRPIILPKDQSTPNLRRSKRTRITPCDYWRGERIAYKRDCTGCCFHIEKVVKGSKNSPKKPKKKVDKLKMSKRKRSKAKNVCNDLSIHVPTSPSLILHNKSHLMEAKKEHKICESSELVWKSSSASKDVFMAIVQKDKSRGTAKGFLKIKGNSEKPRQQTGDYVTDFVLSQGVVSVIIEDSPAFIIKSPAFFQVTRNAFYSLRNLRNDEALLEFNVSKK